MLVYDTLVNVNGIYYVCKQARWARSAGNSAIENVCVIIYYYNKYGEQIRGWMREAESVTDLIWWMVAVGILFVVSISVWPFSLVVYLLVFLFICVCMSLSVFLYLCQSFFWLWLIDSVSHVRSVLHSAVETGEDWNTETKWNSSKNMTARLTVTDNQENHMAILCVAVAMILWLSNLSLLCVCRPSFTYSHIHSIHQPKNEWMNDSIIIYILLQKVCDVNTCKGVCWR